MTHDDRQLLFEDAVGRYFAPLAKKLGVQLERLRKEVFGIQTAHCAMLIRKGTGHRDNILVTLRAREPRERDLDDLSADVGLGVLAAMKGSEIPRISIDTNKGYLDAAEIEADAAETYALPFLLGTVTGFDAVEEFIRSQVKETRISKFRVKNRIAVREEWL